MAASAQTGEPSVGKAAWLSHGFEELLHSGALAYDVIIVGSGYGGAIAAAELAGCTEASNGPAISVCLLERGREYLSGMFPARLAELPLHVRFSTDRSPAPRGRRDGLFDIRIGPDVNAVLANGLGGGSLINAGVMEEPHPAMLRKWPGRVREDLFGRYYGDARRMLGAEGRTISDHRKGKPIKLRAFERLAPGKVREAAISIGVERGHNGEHVRLGECKRCGDCATGCNHGAKNSLDVNLLARAERAGARIFTGVTVLKIERDGGGTWLVHAVHTDELLRKRQGKPATLRARKLILAAGTFGSTEILLRSKSDRLRFSGRLGEQFSSNGDAIAAIYNQSNVVNAVADEYKLPDDRHVGPTITGMLDLRGRWLGRGHVVQEIAIPGPLRRVFEETITIVKTLHELGEADRDEHHRAEPDHDPCAVDAAAIRRTSVFVMMGNDRAQGKLVLLDRNDAQPGDGAIRVDWDDLRRDRLFSRQIKTLEKLARKCGPDARVLPNPLWKLLPDAMHFLLDNRRGPLLTVHPLGGCPMGSNPGNGVVNDLGQVFDIADPHGSQVLDGLVVMDGSIVPNALAINPALTIAALALRAVEGLRKAWDLNAPTRSPAPVRERPSFRAPAQLAPPRPTEIEVIERMTGEAVVRSKDGRDLACVVELTLHFEKRAIAGLVLPVGRDPVAMARELEVREGFVRVFRKARWDTWRRCGESEERLAALAEVRAPLAGTLTVLHREQSVYKERRCRAFWAWLRNRGMRDIWQAVVPRRRRGRPFRPWAWTSIVHRIRGVRGLASRAGEVRLLEYDLRLGAGVWSRKGTPIDIAPFVAEAPIKGLKRLTYEKKSNPWRQLMEMELLEFPGFARAKRSVLALDAKFLAAKGVPLIKIVGQHDQVAALSDMASLLAYFLRLLLSIHVWSFRRPDEPAPRELQRLPKEIKGRLPKFDMWEIPVGKSGGPPTHIRLTRYLPEHPHERPVVMIHGYSASGTTFAHHAVKPNMAEYFFNRGRDVWIVDLRTSSGMPTATHPWSFEEVALADLPAAFEFICTKSGARWVDVFAHCMGAAMFSMAVLSPPDPDPQARFRDAQINFPGRVKRAVLSQIAPVVVMSPANIFRGYAMQYLRHFLPLENYQFRVQENAGLAEQLIDRLLATLPYPEEEFEIENPPVPWRRTPFTGTRHRMDALYGRDFSIADKRGNALLDDAVLEHIDDLFGPLSIETVAQAIHFARAELITNRAGRNEYVLPKRIWENWTFETLSIHGDENGLSDVATLHRFRTRFKDEADLEIKTHPFPGFGHQDCLIGKKAEQVFEVVYRFLDGGAVDAARAR